MPPPPQKNQQGKTKQNKKQFYIWYCIVIGLVFLASIAKQQNQNLNFNTNCLQYSN